MEIILASTSEIRRKILRNAGIELSVVDSELDETEARKSIGKILPRNLAVELAKLKSQKVSREHPRALVIGADQVLGFKGSVFNKPASREEAEKQLLQLRNETHTLFSAVSCSVAGTEVWGHCADARLTMRNFTKNFLKSYLDVDADEYLSSVGAYKLEKTGIQLFETIEGDYFTILGLPMLPLLKFLRDREVVSS